MQIQQFTGLIGLCVLLLAAWGLSSARTRVNPRIVVGGVLLQVALAALLIGPNLFLLVMFTYRPLIDNIRLSFYDWNISSPKATFIGLDNYREWVSAPETSQIVWNTVIFTLATVVGSMLLGLALALLLDQRLRGRGLARSLVFAP